MNKVQRKHFRMFLGTQEFLDNQTHIWDTVPRFVVYKNDFDELIARISEKSEEAQTIEQVSINKEQLKLSLATKVSGLSGGFEVATFVWTIS